ncbi:hypothetical protein AMECASPLE_035676, partial [Ameca splendens]
SCHVVNTATTTKQHTLRGGVESMPRQVRAVLAAIEMLHPINVCDCTCTVH